jgi:hypothetical protein
MDTPVLASYAELLRLTCCLTLAWWIDLLRMERASTLNCSAGKIFLKAKSPFAPKTIKTSE